MRKQDYKLHRHISLGFDATGKLVRKHVYANSEREMTENIVKLKMEFSKYKNPTEITFGRYAEKWNETYNKIKSANTTAYYESGIALLSDLNYKKVKDITKTDMQRIINDNVCHPRTCKKIQQVANSIFESAMADGIILNNPAKKLVLPKYKASEKRALTEKEIEAIKNAELDPKQELAVKLFYYFGLRPEELRALTPSDFDLKGRKLRINKASAFDGNNPILKATKNGKERFLIIPDEIISQLEVYLSQISTFYIFTMQNGQLMTKSSWTKFTAATFKKINEALGGNNDLKLLNGMTFYTFRHTVGTRLYYMQGMSTKMKAYYMGHTEQVFLSTYSHLQEEKENIEEMKKVAL